MAYAWTEFAAFPFQRATLSGTGVRGANPLIMNQGYALNYLTPGVVYDWRQKPKPWPSGEDITVLAIEDDEAGVAHFIGVVLVITRNPNGIPVGVPPLPYFPHTVTVGQMTTGAWTSSALTEINSLPPGEYIMWGGNLISATPVAARMIFPGIDDRPPIIPNTREEDPIHPHNRFWGTNQFRFKIPDQLPAFEGLHSTTETPSELEMYLTKVVPGTMNLASDSP